MINKLIEIPFPNKQAIWKDQAFGIRDIPEFKIYDNRSLKSKIIDGVSIFFNESFYLLKTFSKMMSAKFQKTPSLQFTDPIQTTTEAKALAVFLHGLNGKDSVWDDHKTYIKQRALEIDVFAPNLPLFGHAYLNGEDTQILLRSIVDWTKAHPGKPIALFGQSRGSMYAVRFETLLREAAPSTPIHVSLTGGVLYGTTRVTRFNKWIPENKANIVTGNVLTEIACKELSSGNETAKKLLQEAREPLKEGVAPRDYVMYASHSDLYVPETGSSLPIINEGNSQEGKTQRHYFSRGHGHNSIVGSAVEKQIEDFINWSASI